MQTCIAGNSHVLMADKTYKTVDKVVPGDLVLNMKLEPVKVVMKGETLKSEMVQVVHENWFEPLHCSPNEEILVIDSIKDDTCELKWVEAKDLKQGMIIMSCEEIYDTLPESGTFMGTTLDYSLGLLFGLYAGYGNITENRIEFTFGMNDELAIRVKSICEKLGGEVQINRSDEMIQVRVSNEELLSHFKEFGTKMERCIPQKYWLKKSDYLQGLFEGLIDFNQEAKLCRYITVSPEMCRAFVWITASQGINFSCEGVQSHQTFKVYPLLVRIEQDQRYLSRVLSVTNCGEEKGYYLSVACDTNSMVVNNCVVKSDE